MLIPRSRGAVSGVLLIVLGACGALIPLVGPYFDFTIGPDDPWNFSDGHLWLSVVPGAVVVVGALLLTLSANRATAGIGAWLALAAGLWFVIGEQISRLWNDGASIAGEAAGGTGQRVAEQLAYYDGVGVLIVLFAALALGRLAVRSVRDAELEAAAVDVDFDDDDVIVAPPADRARFEREPEPEPVAVTTTDTTDTTDGTDTLTAADRVRVAADDRTPRRLPGGLLSRFRR